MKVWIYLDGRQKGPFEMEDLVSKAGFDQNTRVWFEGLPKWYPAGSLEQLAPLFDGTIKPTDSENAPQAVEENTEERHSETDTDDQTAQTVQEANEQEEPSLQQSEYPAQDNQPRWAPGRVYRPAQQLAEPCPPSYLGWSIFLMICCCSPLSLGALVASILVSSYYSSGNLDKSKKASEWAAWLIMLSFALGMIPSMFVSALMG